MPTGCEVKEVKKVLEEKIENYKAISIRLLKVTMEWESERVTYFIVYVPDSSYDDLIVEEFVDTTRVDERPTTN